LLAVEPVNEMAPTSCPKKTDCGLAEAISMKEAQKVWQSFYCEGSFARCERFKLANAGLGVPARLLPNGRLQDLQEQPFASAAPTTAHAA
jgi:hypothetical protein